MNQVKLTRFEATIILDAMEDAKLELTTLEDQLGWFSTKVIDRLEQAIAELEMHITIADKDNNENSI